MKKRLMALLLLSSIGNIKSVPSDMYDAGLFYPAIALPVCSGLMGYLWLKTLQPRNPFIIIDAQGIAVINKQQVNWSEIIKLGDRIDYYYDKHGYRKPKKVIFIDYQQGMSQDSIIIDEPDLPIKTTEFSVLIKELATKLRADLEKEEKLPPVTNPLQDLTEEDLKQIQRTGVYKNMEKNCIIVFSTKPSRLKLTIATAVCYPLMAASLYCLYQNLQAYSQGRHPDFNR